MKTASLALTVPCPVFGCRARVGEKCTAVSEYTGGRRTLVIGHKRRRERLQARGVLELTPAQREALQRLAGDNQRRSRGQKTRVQNTLVRLGLAEYPAFSVCSITPAGRALLKKGTP